MLRHANLFDPVERPAEVKDIEFSKYVEIHKHQTAPTASEFVESIKTQFYETGADADKENLDKIWEFVGPKVEKNTGLAEFIKDNNAARSKYFFPWLINVFRSPSLALEISYGAGPDLDGKWDEHILDTDDPIVPFIKDDPAFIYNRERQLYVADLVSTTICEQAIEPETVPKIVDFGAGRMAWARRHGLDLHNSYFKRGYADIYAFDKDPSINLEEFFDQDLEQLGIHFKHGDFIAQLNNPDCKEANLAILGGVASYIPADVFAGKIVPAIYGLLAPKGVLFFDFQTNCPCYKHSMDILDWPEFNLPETPAIVIDSVEKMRKNLWDNGIRLSAEYAVDTYNKIPSAVMVTMQKV